MAAGAWSTLWPFCPSGRLYWAWRTLWPCSAHEHPGHGGEWASICGAKNVLRAIRFAPPMNTPGMEAPGCRRLPASQPPHIERQPIQLRISNPSPFNSAYRTPLPGHGGPRGACRPLHAPIPPHPHTLEATSRSAPSTPSSLPSFPPLEATTLFPLLPPPPPPRLGIALLHSDNPLRCDAITPWMHHLRHEAVLALHEQVVDARKVVVELPPQSLTMHAGPSVLRTYTSATLGRVQLLAACSSMLFLSCAPTPPGPLTCANTRTCSPAQPCIGPTVTW